MNRILNPVNHDNPAILSKQRIGIKMKYAFLCAVIIFAAHTQLFAQHEGHRPAAPKPAATPKPAAAPKPAATPTPSASPQPTEPAESEDPMHMDHGVFVMHGDQMFIRAGQAESNLMPMGRMGSGTSWQPATSPMPMLHKQAGEWLLMFHYNFVTGVNRQGGPRGVTKFESANWFMPSAVRRAGPGTLELRGMFSAEPFTFPPGGSPLLFQTGETYKGEPIIDRQHPHDFISELAATYSRKFGENRSFYMYFGYPGEPALGPPMYLHRNSGMNNPDAPIGHHWQDSTHITHGVFTLGVTAGRFRIESSIFRGAEPDEDRADIEMGKLDSYSGRIWFTPTPNWTMQASYGYLTNPEALEPGDLVQTDDKRWLPVEGSTENELKTFDQGRSSMNQGWSGTFEQFNEFLTKG